MAPRAASAGASKRGAKAAAPSPSPSPSPSRSSRSSAAPAAATAATSQSQKPTWALPRALAWTELLLLIAAVALFCAGADARFPGWLREALRPYDTATVRLSSFSDAQYQTGVMLVVYILQYCALGGLFEGTHPDGALSGSLSPLRLAQRRKQVRSEFATGVVSLSVTVACAVLWMWKAEPRLWTYGYFAAADQGGQGHELTPALAVGGVLAYIAAFDTHFFWSHWLLHESTILWNNVHCAFLAERGDWIVREGWQQRKRTRSLPSTRRHPPLLHPPIRNHAPSTESRLPPLVQGAVRLRAVLRAPARERAAGALWPLLRAALLPGAPDPACAHGFPELGLGLCGARRPRP